MFNDTLSISQCERLLKQLSETAFPFQCAHGRFVSRYNCHPIIALTIWPCSVLQAVTCAFGRDCKWSRKKTDATKGSEELGSIRDNGG